MDHATTGNNGRRGSGRACASLCGFAQMLPMACWASDVAGPSPPEPVGHPDCTTFTGGRISDGDQRLLGAVLVQGEGVVRAVHDSVCGRARRAVDLRSRTLLRRLIDLHWRMLDAAVPRAWADDASFVHEHLASSLRAGVTSALPPGSPRDASVALRASLDAGSQVRWSTCRAWSWRMTWSVCAGGMQCDAVPDACCRIRDPRSEALRCQQGPTWFDDSEEAGMTVGACV